MKENIQNKFFDFLSITIWNAFTLSTSENSHATPDVLSPLSQDLFWSFEVKLVRILTFQVYFLKMLLLICITVSDTDMLLYIISYLHIFLYLYKLCRHFLGQCIHFTVLSLEKFLKCIRYSFSN